jgi:hypothetical protein
MTARPESTTNRRRAPDRRRAPEQNREQRRDEGRREGEEIDEVLRERLDRHPLDRGRARLPAGEGAARHGRQHDQPGMAEQQHQQQVGPGHQTLFTDHQAGIALSAGSGSKPERSSQIQMRDIDQHDDQQRGERSDPEQPAAPALARQHEQHDQAEQDQARIGREDEQAEGCAECGPVEAPVCRQRAVAEQQGERRQRHREHDGAEFERRNGEHADAGHQQDRHRGMRRTDDAAAKREHRPVGSPPRRPARADRHRQCCCRRRRNASSASQ